MWIVTTAWGDWAKFVPKGMVGVCATENGVRGAPERWFLIPGKEYDDRRFVIDLDRHQEIKGPPESMRIS